MLPFEWEVCVPQVIVIAFAITLLTKKPRAENYMVTDDRFVITAPRINVQNKGLPPSRPRKKDLGSPDDLHPSKLLCPQL